MNDSNDFEPQPTAQNKYDMDEKTQSDSMLERVKKAAERARKEADCRYYAKEYAFSCYLCWKHGTRCLTVYEQCFEGPEQFSISCWKCHDQPKKKHASLAQIEKFARAYPRIDISSFETRRRPQVPYRKPVVQNEAARENFEKLFGKD